MRTRKTGFRTTSAAVAFAIVFGLAIPALAVPAIAITPSPPVDSSAASGTLAADAPEDSGSDLVVIEPSPEADEISSEPAGSEDNDTDLSGTGGDSGQGSSSTNTSGSNPRTTDAGVAAITDSQTVEQSTSQDNVIISLPVVQDVQQPATPSCPAAISGSTPGAPSRTSPLGVAGTTSGDLQEFAVRYNAIRVANCLPPVPFSNIRYDSCMEDRLFWMAEDPSTDPMSAWGHIGSQRSDGLPSVGCDGNLAGGVNNDGAFVAQKWWDSTGHRTSLYKPTYTGSTANVCILFAMTHGGVPDEPYSFTRSAARWAEC